MHPGGEFMKYQIKNSKTSLELVLENGIFLRYASPPGRHPVLCEKDTELFSLRSTAQILSSDRFDIIGVHTDQDETEELLTMEAYCFDARLRLRLCFLNNLVDTIYIIFQMADDNAPDMRDNYYFHSPFLASLTQYAPQGGKIYYPANPAAKKDGTSAMQLHPLIHLPLVVTDEDDGAGFAVSFPTLSSLEVAVQNRNVDLWKISSQEGLQNHSSLLRLTDCLSDIAEFQFCGLERGWREAFARVRHNFCRELDMREYERPELKWFSDTFLHHFTFLYSKEAYDYENGRPDIGRLLKDGEEFGGYDTLTLWHQYPRLGVDSRSQWDFFRDFPGSIPGIADAVRTAHEHNAKVLLPYKPWDIGTSQSMDSVLKEITSLLKDTDADGFFLDTMDQAPGKFRRAADAAKPEAVFCSELHPADKDSLSLLTASWDQFWNMPCMPEADLLRFILPSHTAPQISRWQNGSDKDTLINRAVFSGTGLVIWQDVFGSWLPYSAAQKEKIRRYKTLWTRHKSFFTDADAVPFYPVKKNNLYCNRFMDQLNEACIYTFYNDSDTDLSGILAIHRDFQAHICECLWGAPHIRLEGRELTGTVPAGEVIMIKVSGNTP